MSSRHIDLLRGLSAKNREKEEQQRREELRLRKREALLRDRLLRQKGSDDAPVVEDKSPINSSPTPATSSTAIPPDFSASQEEKRQWQRTCNILVAGRQEEAINRLQYMKQVERVSKEREQLKRQWRAHKAKSYLLDNCRNADLKEYLETKTKPRALPKLPDKLQPTAGGFSATASTTERSSSSGASPSSKDLIEDRQDLRSDEFEEEDENIEDRDEILPSAASLDSPSAARACNGSGRQDDVSPTIAGKRPTSPQKDKASASKANLASIAKFLDRVRSSGTVVQRSCSDLAEWKKRNGCPPEKKVFICCGGYPDFINALLSRGWFQNEDKDSRHYDLKWGMASNIDHDKLLPHQVVNHFDKCRELTTKVGLTLHLRQSVWFSGEDVDKFYPRAYDLYDPLERADFVTDFKFSKAESLLREFLRHMETGATTTFSQELVRMCLKICLRTVTDVEEVLDCPDLAEGLGVVSTEEWALLSQVSLDDVSQRLEGTFTDRDIEEVIQKKKAPADYDERQKRTASEKEQKDKDIKEAQQNKLKKDKDKDVKKAKKKKTKVLEEEEVAPEPIPFSVPVSNFADARGQMLIKQSQLVLAEMKDNNRQQAINGGRNAWIVKPSGKSRGRGIQMLRELDEIFHATESDGHQWICQKYIEQPQLIRGYKFDMRQWVLVTDWNPLTVYIWRHPYVRFAGQKYDETLSDRSEYVHLVNNSIIKNMDNFYEMNEDLQTSGYMWFRQQYEEWLHDKYCKCDTHHTPFLIPPPYTCESFGVKFEDVKFVAKDEDDEDGGEDDDMTLACETAGSQSSQQPTVATAASTTGDRSDTSGNDSVEAQQSSRSATQNSTTASAAEEREADVESVAELDQEQPEQSPQHDVPEPKVLGEDVKECENLWETCIKPQIFDIVTWSLLCVVDQVQHRKNSVELFGYDFMVAEGKEKPELWLIEVNSSPACDYSTPVTCPLVKKLMEDTAKVMVDLKDNPEADTGEWELLQHGHNKTVKFVGCGICCPSMEVVGKPMRPPKGWKGKKAKKKSKNATSRGEDDDDEDEEEEEEE